MNRRWEERIISRIIVISIASSNNDNNKRVDWFCKEAYGQIDFRHSHKLGSCAMASTRRDHSWPERQLPVAKVCHDVKAPSLGS